MAFEESDINLHPSEKEDNRPVFGIEEQENLKLTTKTIVSAVREAKEQLEAYVSPENFMIFKHGPDWKTDVIVKWSPYCCQ